MGHRHSYTIGFKLKVIAYYSEMELPNITHVANFFGLKRDNILIVFNFRTNLFLPKDFYRKL